LKVLGIPITKERMTNLLIPLVITIGTTIADYISQKLEGVQGDSNNSSLPA
jgi:hypothetical protein